MLKVGFGGDPKNDSQALMAIENSVQIGRLAGRIPKRSEIQNGTTAIQKSHLTIQVVRNFAAETVTRWAENFLELAGIKAVFSFSDYDDSLTSPPMGNSDLIIIMLDYGRYDKLDEEFQRWLLTRFEYLRNASDSRILVIGPEESSHELESFNTKIESALNHLPGFIFVSPRLEDPCLESEATASISPYYGKRAIEMARVLSWHWIPVAMDRLVRMLILDLDNTLYNGVIAENGLAGIQFSNAHCSTLKALKGLREKGLILAISSKNEREDVDALIDGGYLSPLARTDFLAIQANWNSKSSQVAKILKIANFSADHAVMLDDNPGELVEVLNSFPTLGVALAASAETVRNLVEWHPGLWRISASDADLIRLEDLAANEFRRTATISKNQNPFQQLETVVTINTDPSEQLRRLAELSSKTTQFNTNLSRLNEVELLRRTSLTPCLVMSFELKDRFSNSGIVGFVSGKLEGDLLTIDEVAVSCRALGRGIEDVVLNRVLCDFVDRTGASQVEILYTQGSRNRPALDWLSRTSHPISESRWKWDSDKVDVNSNVRVDVLNAETSSTQKALKGD